MKKIMYFNFLLFFTININSLSYTESSQGLVPPQLDGGRTELEMADVNNDGEIDIISIGDHGNPINGQEYGIMVWFGDGAGGWSSYTNGYFGYGGIALGDVNNDGYLDIGYGMHHNYSNTDLGDSIMEVALGDGTGQNWVPWDDGISVGNPNQWGMFCTDFADIDNDGDLDFGGNSFGAGDGVHIFINNGDGTWNHTFGFLGGNSTMDFLFGDVNNDGYADFCAAHQYGSIYLNDRSGGFIQSDYNLPSVSSIGRMGPSLGDVDNDGDQDFCFCNINGGVEVWTWQSDSSWTSFSTGLPPSGPYAQTQICDMNLDGFMDICAFGDATISMWLGNGAGSWSLETTFSTPTPGYMKAFRTGGDCDHNGYPDIVLVDEEGPWYDRLNHLRFFKETSVPTQLAIYPVFPRGGERFYRSSVNFIKWTAAVPSGEVLVKLELSTEGSSGPWTLIADSLKENNRYQWQLPYLAQGSDSCYIRYTTATATDTVTAVTPSAFSIIPANQVEEIPPHILSLEGLEIYPNPAIDMINIKLISNGGEMKVNIYDISGKLVRELFFTTGQGEFILTWDRRDKNSILVSPGIYFVRLEEENRIIERKIVIAQ